MSANEFYKFLQENWWGFFVFEIISGIFISSISSIANKILGSIIMLWKEQCYLSELLKSSKNVFGQWLPRTRHFIALHAIKAGADKQDTAALIDLLERKISKGESVLVLGKPGSGKTTSLRTLAERIALKTYLSNYAIWLSLFFLISYYLYSISIYLFLIGYIPAILIVSILTNILRRTRLPFFIELRRFREEPDIDAFLTQQTKKSINLQSFTITKRCLFLLDGVNEIESDHYQKFIDSWNSPAFILTCRVGEEPQIDIQNTFTVKELDDAGVNAFIRLYVSSRIAKWAVKDFQKIAIDAKFKFLKDKNLLLENGVGRNPYWLKMLVTTELATPNQGFVFHTFAKNLIEHSIAIPRRRRDPLWKEIVPFEVEMDALGNLALAMTKSGKVGFEGGLDWETAKSVIRGALGDRKESMDDVLFEAQSATLLNVEYKNRIEFSHQLVQEFFTAYALRDTSQWGLALRNINDKNWWRAISMMLGLVSDPNIQGSEDKFEAFSRMVLELNTPFSLIFVIALKGSTTVKGETLCLEIAKKFGLWPKREHVEAVKNISLIIPESLTNGMVEIGNLEAGYAKRLGFLLIAIHSDPDILGNLYSRIKPFYKQEIVNMSRMAPSLGIWSLMPAIYESIHTKWNFYHILRGKRVVKKLIEIAFANEERLQKEALKALGEMQNRYTRIELSNVRAHLNNQLSEFRNLFQEYGNEVLSEICALTENENTQVKVTSIALLKWADDPIIIPYIRNALNAASTEVRLAAAASLWYNKTPEATSLLCDALQKENVPSVQIEIMKSMELSSDARIIPSLLKIIKTSSNDAVKLNALKTLTSASMYIRENRDVHKEEEVKVVNELLSLRFSAEIRAAAINLLWSRLEDKTPLLSYIADRDELVREEVVSWAHPVLRSFGESSYSEILKKGLEDNSLIVKRKAIECLSKYDDEIVLYLVKNLKKAIDKDIRSEIIKKLGYSKSQLAVPILVTTVRKYTQPIFPINIPFVKKEEDHNELENALSALGNIESQSAIDVILEATKNKNLKFRVYAVRALSDIKSDVARKALEDISRNDPDKSVREEAAESLGIIGNEETINTLRQDTESEDETVKQNAVEVLKIMEADDAMEVFAKKLTDPNEAVRISSIEGVCRLCNQDIENLKLIIPLISDTSKKVSEVAIRGLVFILMGQELEIFGLGFASEIIRQIKLSSVSSGFRQIRKDPFSAFRESMNMRGRQEKLEILEQQLIAEVVQALLPRIQQPELEEKIIAAKALGKLQARTALPELENLLLDEYLEVVLAAAQAINDIDPDYLREYAD